RGATERWASYPVPGWGFQKATDSAQAVTWDRAVWRKVGKRKLVLHPLTPGISHRRFLRAALLEDRLTGLRCWFATTHFVVGGDEKGDDKVRRDVMAQDLRRFNIFLAMLSETGYPVVFQMDANLRPSSDIYPKFNDILYHHRATLRG